MIELTFAQRENIGFQYVLEAMRPCSPYGQERLRELRPLTRAEQPELLRQLGNIQRVLDGETACQRALEQLLRILMTVKMVRSTAKKCLETDLNGIELFELKRFLLRTHEMLPHWREAQSVLRLEGIDLRDTEAALDILDPEHNRVASFYISDAHHPLLCALRKEKRSLEEQLRAETDDITREALLSRRSDAAAREEAEEARIRQAMSLALRPHIPAMLENMEAVGDLDLTVEKARLVRHYGGVMPSLTDQHVVMESMTNPRSLDLLRAQDKTFTPVSIALDRGATVITGANMGGKSVALKTLALNILLVHCGFFAFAAKAATPLFDSMHILSEDLEAVDRGLSSFGGEIVRFNEVVRELDAGFPFIILDEFARGTNPDEGAAIVQAVTAYLNGKHAVSVLATHYDHVAPYANAHYQVIGLRDLDPAQLRQELLAKGQREASACISRYMNYGLYRVEGPQDCPRDAVHICSLLGMEPEILEMAGKSLEKRRKNS